MPEFSRIPWARLLAEGTAVVISILLAFAIDAWWDRRAETIQATAVLRGLQEDFRDSQLHLKQWLAGNRKIQRGTAMLLENIRNSGKNSLVPVTAEMILAPIGAPTYDPTTSTLDTALASGRIDLIENEELRHELTLWRQQLADTREDEFLIRDIVVHRLVPLVAQQVRLGFAFEQIHSWFIGESEGSFEDPIELLAVPELEGVLAQRLFYTNYVVEGQSQIYETQARILELLGAALNER